MRTTTLSAALALLVSSILGCQSTLVSGAGVSVAGTLEGCVSPAT